MSGAVLIDSNVLLDIFTEDSRWLEWSSTALAGCAENGLVAINPIIYAEVSVRFDGIEDLDEALPEAMVQRLPLPWDAAFLAGRSFLEYRRRRGLRPCPLPDLYIGAHAAVTGMTLLTRDPARYRTYFPRVRLMSP